MTRIGRYLVHDTLRAEPLARVYHARLIDIERQVLLERLSPPPSLSKQDADALREAFVLETRRLGTVGDPAIARPFDFGETENGVPFRTFERPENSGYRPVESLSASLGVHDAVRLGVRIARAYAVARAAGVALEQFDPACTYLGPSGEVLVVPLGVGRLVTALGLPAALRAESLPGTPPYAREGTGSAAFSIAAWLYRELSGPVRRSPMEKLAVGQLPEPLWQLNAACPGGLDEVIQAALHPHAPRISSPSALAEALERWLDQNATRVQPIPTSTARSSMTPSRGSSSVDPLNDLLRIGGLGTAVGVAAVVSAWVLASIVRGGR